MSRLNRRREGAEEARLRFLYADCAGDVFGLAYRSLRDRELAEEVVQETFLRVWRSRGSYDPARSSLRGWLFVIARNLIIDAARARMSRPQAYGSCRWGIEDTEDPLESVLLSAHVSDALRNLSEDHRRVIFEVHFRDRPYAEIASELGVPIATLRTRMYYALRSLRLSLKDAELPTPSFS